MHKKLLINKKPAYYRGQLLLEDDFIAEQRYHANARYRHSLNLHGWGVVRGLEVRHAGTNEIVVSPGFAIDGRGHEIELVQEEKLEVPSNSANSTLMASLVYDEDDAPAADSERRTRKCYAVLSLAVGVPEAAVVLASVELDEHSRVTAHGIGTTNRRTLKTPLSPGCVTARALDPHLRTGWLRMPFRPTAWPSDEQDAPPPFRVGPTEARSHREIKNEPNTQGAGGTMAISLAPGVTRVLKLRIAGAENDGRLKVELYIGGWDAANKRHVADVVLAEEVKGGPYDHTWDVSRGDIHLESSTLSIAIRADGYARVSLVAVEVTCDPALLQIAPALG